MDGGSASRKAATHTGQHRQKKRIKISMPQVGFEPTTPVFGQGKTVYDLDRADTVIGHAYLFLIYIYIFHTPICIYEGYSESKLR
jgi:hypothetical protein